MKLVIADYALCLLAKQLIVTKRWKDVYDINHRVLIEKLDSLRSIYEQTESININIMNN